MSNVIRFSDLKKKHFMRLKDFNCVKLTAMFNPENYLFFDYEFLENMRNIMVVESIQGETLFIEDCNCGYNGNGPRNTKEILKTLGIEEQEAERLMMLNGFQIQFDNHGKYLKDIGIEGLPFENRDHEKETKIHLNSNMVANLSKKQLYFMEAKGNLYLSLIKTLDQLDVRRMIAYIGNENYNY